MIWTISCCDSEQGKRITQHLPIPFPPLSSANGRAETEAEWGSGITGDGSPGDRKRKGTEKAFEPIDEDDGVLMMVSSAKFLPTKLT